MERVALGNTGLVVSRMCFGTLGLGPLQLNMGREEGAQLIRKALEIGINFFDTAEIYGTYSYLREGLRGCAEDVVVASKSYAYSRQGMIESVEQARRELGRDVIEIFMLHEQDEVATLRGHGEALDYLLEAKELGIVRAVGVSTHSAEVAEVLAEMSEIDVILALVNRDGVGIKGGLGRMVAALRKAVGAGKGVYAMKALAGGKLHAEFEDALRFVCGLDCVHSVAVGVGNELELAADAAVISGAEVAPEVRRALAWVERRVWREPFCDGCGRCVEACKFGAIQLVNGKSEVDHGKCVLCGYCVGACPGYYIKVGQVRERRSY
ncbi:MAG: aldo/keto reductase [Bacillota bacterium]